MSIAKNTLIGAVFLGALAGCAGGNSATTKTTTPVASVKSHSAHSQAPQQNQYQNQYQNNAPRTVMPFVANAHYLCKNGVDLLITPQGDRAINVIDTANRAQGVLHATNVKGRYMSHTGLYGKGGQWEYDASMRSGTFTYKGYHDDIVVSVRCDVQ